MLYADLEEILEKAGIKSFGVTGDNYLRVRCPYADSRHKKGIDRKPSATISFGQEESVFRCFTCGTRRPVYRMILDLVQWNLGKGFQGLAREAQAKEIITDCSDQRPIPKLIDYTSELKKLLKNRPSKEAGEFLRSKGVNPAFARKYFKVSFIPEGYKTAVMAKPAIADCVYFPLLIHDSKAGIKCIGGGARPLSGKCKYYAPFTGPRLGHLYGEHLQPKVRGNPLFIVEGFLDAIHLWELGFCSYAAMGVGFSGTSALVVKNSLPSVVLIYMDPDSAGAVGSARVHKSLKLVGVKSCQIRNDKDPKACSKEEVDNFVGMAWK